MARSRILARSLTLVGAFAVVVLVTVLASPLIGASSGSGAGSGSSPVAVAGMVSRPLTPCDPPGCTPRPGRVLQYGGLVVEAENALFAPITFPAGARLVRIEVVGFDQNAVSSDVHLGASLYRVDDKSGRGRLVGFVATKGGSSGERISVQRRAIAGSPRVVAGSGYYVQLLFPSSSQQARPAGASMIRVVYRLR